MYILLSPDFDGPRRLASSIISPVTQAALEASQHGEYVWVDFPSVDFPSESLTVPNMSVPSSPQDILQCDEQFEMISRSMLPSSFVDPTEGIMKVVEPEAIPPHRSICFASEDFRRSLPEGHTAYLMMQAGGRTFYHIVPLPPKNEFYGQTTRVGLVLQGVTGITDAKMGKNHEAVADILNAMAATMNANQSESIQEEKVNRVKVPQLKTFFQKRQQYCGLKIHQELRILMASLWNLYEMRPKESLKIANEINVEFSKLCQTWRPLSFAVADMSITSEEMDILNANIVAFTAFKSMVKARTSYSETLVAEPLAKTDTLALRFRRKKNTNKGKAKLNAIEQILTNLLTKLLVSDLQELQSVDGALRDRVKEGERMLFERRLAEDAVRELDIVGKVMRSLGQIFLDPNVAMDAGEFEEFLDLADQEGRPFPCKKMDTGLVVKYRKVVKWYLERQKALGRTTTASPFYGDLKALLHFAMAPRSVENWNELITALEAKNARFAGTSKPSWSVVVSPSQIPASAPIDQTVTHPPERLMSARIPLSLRGDSSTILRVFSKLKRAGGMKRMSTTSSTASTKSQKSKLSLFSLSKQKTENDAPTFGPNDATISRHGSESSIGGSVCSTRSKGKMVKSSKFPFLKRSTESHLEDGAPISRHGSESSIGSATSLLSRSNGKFVKSSKFPFLKRSTESHLEDGAPISRRGSESSVGSAGSVPTPLKWFGARKRSEPALDAKQDLMRIEEETPSPM
ncbi:MAG: hypothetical protein KVP17_003987 [Porospora cf. gigantea B]|uniref:uncharacterized protein n=1 Tax=Porospora cf. gigantea B TaxID=2853592 RepID=UPI003571C33B|nr:MAG: hypothetical protein KVP17_003987 [Porospora cf. gigantea B]